MPLIGFVGPAGSGKDTACEILVNEYDFQHLAFADPMRDVLKTLNPIVGPHPAFAKEGKSVRWNEAVEKLGYNQAKMAFGQEGRRLLQKLGTEVGREMWGDSFWVDRSLARIKGPNVCWSDVRFLNEAAGIHNLGGWIVRINRPSAGLKGEAGQHASETEADSILGEEIDNTGSLQEFKRNVRDVVEFILTEDAKYRGPVPA